MKEITLTFKPNCRYCLLSTVCCYREKMADFRKTMHGMFAYEDNNLLTIFEDNASKCKYYHRKSDEGLKETARHDVFSEIVGIRCRQIRSEDAVFEDGRTIPLVELYKYIKIE